MQCSIGTYSARVSVILLLR